MPYIGQGLSEGRRRAYNFVATSNQTVFQANYDVGYVDVYQNGILLTTSDYTATNGTTVVLGVGASASDEITIIAHQIFAISDTVSAGQGGSFGGAIDVTGNITTTGSLRGPSSFTIDPATHGDNTGTVVIAGDLTVNGTTTTINSTTLTVDDKNVILASGSSNSSTADGSGLTIDLGSDGTATMLYTHATTSFSFNKEIRSPGLNSSSDIYLGGDKGIFFEGSTNDAYEVYLRSVDATGDRSIRLPDASGTIALTNDLSAYAPLTGATMTGDLVINSDGQTTGGACLQIDNTNTSNSYPKAIEAYMTSMGVGQTHQIMIGKDGSTNDTGTLAFYYAGSASASNRLQLGMWGSGSTLCILGSGNVGIGTTNPDVYYSKDLVLSAVDEGGMTIVSDPAHRAYIMFADGASGGSERYRGQISYDHANDQMSFTTAASTAVTIDSNGDFGIGVAPYTNARLTIGGGDGGGYPAVLMYDNNNTSGAEFFMLATDTNWSAGANKFIMGHGAPASSNTDVTIDSNGYVGINTTSPQRAFHIHDHSATGLHITNTQSGAGANDGFSMYIRDDNQATELMGRENTYLGFGTNGTLRAQIESTGEFFWPEIGNRGDLTFPICSISNSGAGARYLHAQFQVYGGDMYHIHFLGYDYTASIRQGSGGGYMYNAANQTSAFNGAYSGNCVAVHQTTTNRVELVIDTGGSATSNRWGSMVFFGGTDTITGNHPIKLVQYAWNAYTARLYSS